MIPHPPSADDSTPHAHDPLLCGLTNLATGEPWCPACAAEQAGRTAAAWDLVRAELRAILERYDAADRRLLAASVHEKQGDREAAERERQEAAGDRLAAGVGLADLFLLMLRQAQEYRADALRLHLADALKGELEPIADAVVALQEAKK